MNELKGENCTPANGQASIQTEVSILTTMPRMQPGGNVAIHSGSGFTANETKTDLGRVRRRVERYLHSQKQR